VASVRGAGLPALEACAIGKLTKYARPENERRFLLARLPEDVDPAVGYEQLDDLYLDGTRLRLRHVRSSAGEVIERKLTQKLPDPAGQPARRLLTTLYLDAAEYELLARLPGRRLSKRRHRLVHAGRRFAIDAFGGPLAGLLLAEAELESEAALAMLAAALRRLRGDGVPALHGRRAGTGRPGARARRGAPASLGVRPPS
jgi:CYTH domain-containing protein